ncbi:MAG: hypothetical protein AB7Q17_11055 [Phycisphaerae bacterium]
MIQSGDGGAARAKSWRDVFPDAAGSGGAARPGVTLVVRPSARFAACVAAIFVVGAAARSHAQPTLDEPVRRGPATRPAILPDRPSGTPPGADFPGSTRPPPSLTATQPGHELFTCPVTADTAVFSALPNGRDVNNGGGDRIDVLGGASFGLFQFDLSALRRAGDSDAAPEWEVTRAVLRVRRSNELLVRVGVSTIATEWVEGTGAERKPQPGSACFSYAAYAPEPDKARAWAYVGSDVTDAVFGNGGSHWAAVVPRFDAKSLWYEIDVPPALVQALVQRVQLGGLALADDFGRGQTQPAVFSRESDDPPELVVEARRAAAHASAAPTEVSASRDTLGLEWVRWRAPGALGVEVFLSEREIRGAADLASATKLPIWALPSPPVRRGDASAAVLTMHRTARHRFVAARAIESGGVWSVPVCVELPPPVTSNPKIDFPTLERFDLPQTWTSSFTMDDSASLSLDGRWIRTARKCWWHPTRGPITLEAARKEVVSFQVVLSGGPGAYRVMFAEWQSPGAAAPQPRVQFYRQHYSQSRLGRDKYAPDGLTPIESGAPLVLDLLPLTATQPIAGPPDEAAAPDDPAATAPAATQPAPRGVVQAIWTEITVPASAERGVWRCRLIVTRDGAAELDLPVELTVTPATLPNETPFAATLTAYAPPGPRWGFEDGSPDSWELLDACYRLTQQHRATLAVVPYRSDGTIYDGFAPDMTIVDGAPRFDWSAWDERFARYFNGDAFRDLPREAVPLAQFYLPIHENWPALLRYHRAAANAPLARKYHYRATRTEVRTPGPANPTMDSYMVWPIEDALAPEYRAAIQQTVRDFAAHIRERNWRRTDFQMLLVNRAAAGERSTWWMLGQPEVYDDFQALAYWLGAYREALAGSDAPLRVRADLAAPELQRDTLDGLVQLSLLNSAFFQKSYTITANPQRFGEVWTYGGAVEPELGFAALLKWGWASRLAGARGVQFTESLGKPTAWEKADTGALLYPPRADGAPLRPLASVRLKLVRRLQQDMGWLELAREAAAKSGHAEGYFMAVVGTELAQRAGARPARPVSFLPVVEFPGNTDPVVWEELRRGLRRAAGGGP